MFTEFLFVSWWTSPRFYLVGRLWSFDVYETKNEDKGKTS